MNLLQRCALVSAQFFLALTLCWTNTANAEQAVPPLSGHVVDMTGTLTLPQKAALEQSLQAFEAKKGSQIAVLIVATTAPEAIEQYSLRVVEQWKLGRKKVDDGALLLIAKNDRTMRIEVGYGLEGALNDAVSKRITSEIITPSFKLDDFYGGISGGVNSMMNVVDGEPLPAVTQTNRNNKMEGNGAIPFLFFAVMAGGALLRSVLGRLPGAVATGGLTALLAWLMIGAIGTVVIAAVLAFLVTLMGGGMRGMAGGAFGSAGSGSSSSGGGGGFSGGGGGFGGGGASGRW